MTDIMAISALSMHQDMQRLDIISHNLANVATPGFKRDIAVLRSFADQFNQGIVESSRVFIGTDATLPTMTSVTDFAQGAMRNTGNRLDVAIEGEGFFELESAGGRSYSRQGSFQLDASGRLLSAQGLTVNGLGGEIRLTNHNPRIDQRGAVWDGEDIVAQLRIVKFNRADALVKAGNGSFVDEGNAQLEAVIQPSLRQGFVETSNIEVMDEMVQMMTILRHFEATRHVIQGYDEMLGTAIETIAEF